MLDFDSSKAYRLWKGVSTNARTTFSCVINQLHTSIAPFNTEALGGLMWSQESFDFRVLGRAGRPTALFIVCSDVSRELDPLVSTLEAQLFEELVRMADDEMDGELEQPVTFYLDDFASGTPLPDAPKLFANVRSRGIRMVAVIQSLSQLRRLYGADADSIVENCDVKVLMGGVADANALLYFNRGLEDRELAGMIARDTVLVFRKGLGARVSTRYDLTSHPNYEHFEEAKRAARGIADGLADGIIERVISESAHEESSRQKTDRSKREAE